MNETTILIVLGGALCVGYLMWGDQAKKAKKAEEETLYTQLLELPDKLTKTEAHEIIDKLPAIGSTAERDLWRELLSGHVEDFLRQDGTSSQFMEFLELAKDSGTNNLLRGWSREDIRDITHAGPFEDFYMFVEPIPNTGVPMVFVGHTSDTSDQGYFFTSADWVYFNLMLDYVLTTRSLTAAAGTPEILEGIRPMLGAFFTKIRVEHIAFDEFPWDKTDFTEYDEPTEIAKFVSPDATGGVPVKMLDEMMKAISDKYGRRAPTDEQIEKLWDTLIDFDAGVDAGVDFTDAHAYYDDAQRAELRKMLYGALDALEFATYYPPVTTPEPVVGSTFVLPRNIEETRELLMKQGYDFDDVEKLQTEYDLRNTLEQMASVFSDAAELGELHEKLLMPMYTTVSKKLAEVLEAVTETIPTYTKGDLVTIKWKPHDGEWELEEETSPRIWFASQVEGPDSGTFVEADMIPALSGSALTLP